MVRQIKFSVSGMNCAACQARVEQAAGKVDGVLSAVVNLSLATLEVSFDADGFKASDVQAAVLEAVSGAGYPIVVDDKTFKDKLLKMDAEAVDRILSLRWRFVWSLLCLIPLNFLAMYEMYFGWFGVEPPRFLVDTFGGTENLVLYGVVQLLLTIPVLIINREFFVVGFKHLFKGSANMDTLIALGGAASVLFGLYQLIYIAINLSANDVAAVEAFYHAYYFESAAMVLTIVCLGRMFDAMARRGTNNSQMALAMLLPSKITVVDDEQGSNPTKVSPNVLEVGDLFLISAADVVPADGIVVSGHVLVDEAFITGESIPVSISANKSNENEPNESKPGANDTRCDVVSGTVVTSGNAIVRSTGVGSSSTLSRVIELVETTNARKAPIANIADKVAGVFVPVVIGISIVTAIVWALLGQDIEFVISRMVAVLVVSCPCAMGLATPLAILLGTGASVKKGILFKSGEAVEQLARISDIALDKTGTITVGRPEVVLCDVDDEVLRDVALIEQNSSHPLARSVVTYAKDKGVFDATKIEKFIEVSEIPGKGMVSTVDGHKYFVGNNALLEDNGVLFDGELRRLETSLLVARDGEYVGAIYVADSAREDSSGAIGKLSEMGINVYMITGDKQSAARLIADEVGIDANRIVSEVRPEGKSEAVSSIKDRSEGLLAMVGDGINDAPALAASDVGIAIGSGSNIAVESAQVVLMNSNLSSLVDSITMSKRMLRIIKQNLMWAFLYNIILIPVAAGVFAGLGLVMSPMFAAAAMGFSSISVVLNSLRLSR